MNTGRSVSRYVATVADVRVAAAVAKPPDGRG
jgi:hypothetical protein